MSAALLALSACDGGHESESSEGTYSVYRHSMDGAPSSLDPAQASNIYANFLAVNLYDTLYRYKYLARPYELQPNLAEDLPQVSADGLIYTIRIKPGVYFINDPAFAEGRGRAAPREPGCGKTGSWGWTSGRRTGRIMRRKSPACVHWTTTPSKSS